MNKNQNPIDGANMHKSDILFVKIHKLEISIHKSEKIDCLYYTCTLNYFGAPKLQFCGKKLKQFFIEDEIILLKTRNFLIIQINSLIKNTYNWILFLLLYIEQILHKSQKVEIPQKSKINFENIYSCNVMLYKYHVLKNKNKNKFS